MVKNWGERDRRIAIKQTPTKTHTHTQRLNCHHQQALKESLVLSGRKDTDKQLDGHLKVHNSVSILKAAIDDLVFHHALSFYHRSATNLSISSPPRRRCTSAASLFLTSKSMPPATSERSNRVATDWNSSSQPLPHSPFLLVILFFS